MKTKWIKITVNGKQIKTDLTHPCQFDSLDQAGWIRVTHCGEENVYFIFKDDSGKEHEGYCKCLC